MHVQISKEIKEKPFNVILSDESNSENSDSLSDNRFAFVAFFGVINGCTDMYQTVTTLSESDKYQIVNKFSISDINQIVSYFSDLNITSIIVDHELSL
jgi:hypothetical protein